MDFFLVATFNMNPYMACDAPNPFLIWSWLRISFAAYWTSRVNRGRQGIEMKAKHRCCSTCWVNNQNKMVRLPPGLAITVVSAGPHHPDRECNDDSTNRKYPAVQICFWWAIAWIYRQNWTWIGLDCICLTTTYVLRDILAVLHK